VSPKLPFNWDAMRSFLCAVVRGERLEVAYAGGIVPSTIVVDVGWSLRVTTVAVPPLNA